MTFIDYTLRKDYQKKWIQEQDKFFTALKTLFSSAVKSFIYMWKYLYYKVKSRW